uniref:NAD(P)-binding domain-containing protein n=1 Tax=Odontella aurita TaxID=265563 RepID=A0A7S4MXP4_9STRA|mmetsp:Transcript_3741/g.10043  ORF Transcript_3741/g.10043 Transcript_3741/m.10043 type:complete len:475 (+) Transcript_3741:64-1488(+)
MSSSRGNYSRVGVDFDLDDDHDLDDDADADADFDEADAHARAKAHAESLRKKRFVPETRRDPDDDDYERRSYPLLRSWFCLCVGIGGTFVAFRYGPLTAGGGGVSFSSRVNLPPTLRGWGPDEENDDDPEYGLKDTVPIEPHVGKKKVMVTGAGGFVGSHVAEFLLDRGDDVVVVDEMNDYYDVRVKEENLAILQRKAPDVKGTLSIYRGDVANETFIRDVFRKERPKWICHLAARAGVRYSIFDPYVYIHSNIEGTVRLMDLGVEYNVTNFVYASSSSVYGGSKSTYFSEAENVDRPISPYAASKKSVELMAYTWHHLYGLPLTGLRFFTVYGPRGRPDMAPFIFVDRISRGKQIKQFGDGSTSRDYTYVDDIVDGIVRAVDRPYGYEVFNLGKGNGTKLSDFIHLVQKYTNRTADIKVLPEQPGDVPYTCADVEKAGRLLGYNARIQFEEGIRRTAEWYASPTAVIAKTEDD